MKHRLRQAIPPATPVFPSPMEPLPRGLPLLHLSGIQGHRHRARHRAAGVQERSEPARECAGSVVGAVLFSSSWCKKCLFHGTKCVVLKYASSWLSLCLLGDGWALNSRHRTWNSAKGLSKELQSASSCQLLRSIEAGWSRSLCCRIDSCCCCRHKVSLTYMA